MSAAPMPSVTAAVTAAMSNRSSMEASVSVLNVWPVPEMFTTAKMVVVEMIMAMAEAEAKTECRAAKESKRVAVSVTVWIVVIGIGVGVIRISVVPVILRIRFINGCGHWRAGM